MYGVFYRTGYFSADLEEIYSTKEEAEKAIKNINYLLEEFCGYYIMRYFVEKLSDKITTTIIDWEE